MLPQYSPALTARREYVCEHYQADGEAAVAEVLGLTRRAVKNIAWRLGLLSPRDWWRPDEDAVLREWYARPIRHDGFLDELAAVLRRSRASVALRASRLGLANYSHQRVAELKRPPFVSQARYTPEERRRVQGQHTKQWIAEHGHPRGALGMKHSAETRTKLSAASRRMWADPESKVNSEANRQRLSDEVMKRIREGRFVSGERMYSRTKAGKRADLANRYFRSRWEANYARFLNWMQARGEIVAWEYECFTFWFEAIKRGTRCYTPDFRVVFPDGHHEWHEVKGWMDAASRVRLERMARYYPGEIVKVIGEDWFKQATKTGLAGAIPHWERRQ